MKKTLIIALTLVVALGFISSSAYAFKGGEGQGRFQKKAGQKDMFFKKVKLIYRFQEELGVTDEQLDTLKEVKVSLKKDVIRKKAEIDILKVDIKAAMYEEEIDVTAVNALIDKKYEIKKAKAKATVSAIAELKKVLTEEQKDKLKSLLKEKMVERKEGRRGRGPHEDCPMKGGMNK